MSAAQLFPAIANSRLGWLFRRLGCMSPAEVVHRTFQLLLVKRLKLGLGRSTPLPAPDYRPGVALPLIDKERFGGAYIDEAREILAGKIPLFSTKHFLLTLPIQWNVDPLTGTQAPLAFGPEIPVSVRKTVGDIKHIWELNRHLHLVRLAQAFVLSGDREFLDGLRANLVSWLDQCPDYRGPNWTSSLELGIRLINWSFIWRMLGGWDSALFSGPEGAAFRTRWLASIHRHCEFIARHPSRYSSANNHLIGEMAGLYVASRTWPYWPRSAEWAEASKRELEQEAVSQYFADGANREQATAYHVFSTEFLVVTAIYGTLSEDAFSTEYWMVIQRALAFLRSIRDTGGNVPMFGDADDGIAWRLEPRDANDRAAMLLSLGEALISGGRGSPWPETALWLLGCSGAEKLSPVEDTSAIQHQFQDSGYLHFGTDFGTSREIKGIVDCGPLGYLGIAAHGHADALSVILSVGGEECLIDPGTYSYWSELKWREYFRGTSAHNTLRVDGCDQSVAGGRFMWTRKANCMVSRMPTSPDLFRFVGFHDGYMRLSDALRHTRSVNFDARQGILAVADEATAGEPHLFEQFWHFAPDLRVEAIGNTTVMVRGRRFSMTITFDGCDRTVELIRGQETPPLGWCSRHYEQKEPCTTLRVSARTNTFRLRTSFSTEFSNTPTAITAE